MAAMDSTKRVEGWHYGSYVGMVKKQWPQILLNAERYVKDNAIREIIEMLNRRSMECLLSESFVRSGGR